MELWEMQALLIFVVFITYVVVPDGSNDMSLFVSSTSCSRASWRWWRVPFSWGWTRCWSWPCCWWWSPSTHCWPKLSTPRCFFATTQSTTTQSEFPRITGDSGTNMTGHYDHLVYVIFFISQENWAFYRIVNIDAYVAAAAYHSATRPTTGQNRTALLFLLFFLF